MLIKDKKILDNYLNDLQNVDSLEKMDQLINKITNSTNTVCKNFRCTTGCFTCCKGSNLPPVRSKEWQRIRENIKKKPEDIKNQIKENFEHLLKRHETLLNSVNNFLQENYNQYKISKIIKYLKNEYSEEICPLHINGKCSVYEVRPAKCSGFGYFSYKMEKKVILLTCNDLANDITDFYPLFNKNQIIFPFWNSFENKLNDIAIDDSEAYKKAIIPFWLKNDFESGNLE